MSYSSNHSRATHSSARSCIHATVTIPSGIPPDVEVVRQGDDGVEGRDDRWPPVGGLWYEVDLPAEARQAVPDLAGRVGIPCARRRRFVRWRDADMQRPVRRSLPVAQTVEQTGPVRLRVPHIGGRLWDGRDVEVIGPGPARRGSPQAGAGAWPCPPRHGQAQPHDAASTKGGQISLGLLGLPLRISELAFRLPQILGQDTETLRPQADLGCGVTPLVGRALPLSSLRCGRSASS